MKLICQPCLRGVLSCALVVSLFAQAPQVPEVPKAPEVKAPGISKPKLPFGGANIGKLKQIALNIPTGSPVSLTMKDKTKLSGKIGPVNNDGFDVQTVENGNIVNKAVGFDQLAKLSAGAPKGTLRSISTPVLTIMSLIGTAGAITAAIRK